MKASFKNIANNDKESTGFFSSFRADDSDKEEEQFVCVA